MLGWTPGSYDALNPLMQLMSRKTRSWRLELW